jgi:polyisoprenoid-binding protein YceI
MLAVFAAGLLAAPAAAETFQLDQDHTKVMFSVRHLGISKVTGRFTKFEGSFDYDAGQPKSWKTDATIDASSINTDVEARDKHLRSADFFDVEKCPKIEFKSTKVTGVKGGKAKLHGDLTIHCVTKPVVLDLEINGSVKDPWGGTHVGASATGKINRKDFGLTWNKALETGGLLVGEEVEITLEVDGKAGGGKG